MIDGIQGYPDGFVRLGCPWTEAEESSQGDQEGTILEKKTNLNINLLFGPFHVTTIVFFDDYLDQSNCIKSNDIKITINFIG